jgi:hypothetical protein
MAPFKRTFQLAMLLCVVWPVFVARAQKSAGPEDELWLSDGYGLLVEIRGDGLQAFELTSISCVPGWSAKREPTSGETREEVFIGNDTFRLSGGPSGDVKRLHLEGVASDILLHRTSTRPAACSRKPDDSPQGNYAIFWQTFAENYPFFNLRHVDWQSVDREFRPRVTSATKPDQLFGILQQMIEPLHDAHTGIEAEDVKKDFDGWREDPNHLENEGWKKAQEIIDTRYIRGALRSFCNGQIQFGALDHSIGYLRIIAFYGYVDHYTYELALRALRSALDEIFRKASKLNGLVIDVRLNKGGDDPLGLEIASRLTKGRYLAYSKVARNNLEGTLHFTAPQGSWVLPSTHPGFRGNVVLLTGPDTVSAGETFAMALLGREPHVTRIGQNTQGVFSDVLNRKLPNGWRFGLPNEVYLTSDGNAFDGTGIPPDIRLSFFSAADLSKGRDEALEEAQTFLTTAAERTTTVQPSVR